MLYFERRGKYVHGSYNKRKKMCIYLAKTSDLVELMNLKKG